MNKSIRTLAMLGLAAGLALTVTVRAAESEPMSSSNDDAMEELRSTLGDLSAQVNNLGSGLKGLVKFSGDFRYRYEKLDNYGAAPSFAGRAVDRERYRIRLRLGAEGKVNDFAKVKVRLATGGIGANVDPVSTNQTLGDYGDKKGFFLDIAEMVLEPKGFWLSPKAELGKFPTPFVQPEGELLFDGDLTPEGIAVSLNQPLGMGLDLKVIGAQFLNAEISGDTRDPKFEGGQVIAIWEGPVEVKVAGGYYNWINQNMASYAAAVSQNNNTAGIEFDVVDAFASIKGSLFGIGTEAYYQYEKNAMVENDNDGYLAGISLASGKLIPLAGDWLKLSYNFREQKKDATFSPWNFSDFAGGKTDALGSMVSGKIKVADGVEAALTYFSNSIGMKAAANGGNAGLFERWQADLAVKF